MQIRKTAAPRETFVDMSQFLAFGDGSQGTDLERVVLEISYHLSVRGFGAVVKRRASGADCPYRSVIAPSKDIGRVISVESVGKATDDPTLHDLVLGNVAGCEDASSVERVIYIDFRTIDLASHCKVTHIKR